METEVHNERRRHDESGQCYRAVIVPGACEGVGNALHRVFDHDAKLPPEFERLLQQLN